LLLRLYVYQAIFRKYDYILVEDSLQY